MLLRQFYLRLLHYHAHVIPPVTLHNTSLVGRRLKFGDPRACTLAILFRGLPFFTTSQLSVVCVKQHPNADHLLYYEARRDVKSSNQKARCTTPTSRFNYVLTLIFSLTVALILLSQGMADDLVFPSNEFRLAT